MKYAQPMMSLLLGMSLLAAPCFADEPPVSQPPADEAATTDAAPAKEAAAPAKKEETKAAKPAKRVVPLADQLDAAIKRLTPKLKDKRIIAAAVPHYANKEEHWPAAPAVLNQLVATLQEFEHAVPARVEHLVLGELATPPKELVDNLQEQFAFDLLMTADYQRSDEAIAVSIRVFDAKTQKRIHQEKFDLGNDVNMLGYAENRKVWEYCHSVKGYMVGNGECWTLAATALVESQAQHPFAFQYGRPIAMDDLLVPGDLIQIEGVSIQGPNHGYITMGHHTAIVHNVLGGGVVELIHQNGPPLGRYVCLLPVNIYTQQSGSMMPYRPIPIEMEETAEQDATMIGAQ